MGADKKFQPVQDSNTYGWIQAELFMKEPCIWRVAVPYEGVGFWKVYLNCLKNPVTADAVEGLLNIKF